MKSLLKMLSWILLSFISFVSFAIAADLYTIDPHHSYVMYSINHLGFSTQTGKWFVSGTIMLDQTKPEQSTVSVNIPLANIVTGIPDLDSHLKGKLFFDVGQYPIATFASNKIIITGKNSAKILGTLNLHGVSKQVELNVTMSKKGVNPISSKESLGFSASTILNRSNFNISTLSPGLGDEVKINIEVEAYKGK